MLQAPPASDGALGRFLEWCVSALGGALVALVAFRTRLALMDKRLDSQETARAELKLSIESHLSLIDRRQLATLQVLADVAHKIGVEGRFSDLVMKFLADDQG